MSVYRKTALTTIERNSWEGNYFDSYTHAKMFRDYGPHMFGVKSAELYSSKLGSQFLNKKFIYFTVAQNNCYYTPGGVDDYSWKLVSPYARTFRITENLLGNNTQPGKMGEKFKIALDTNGLMEPVVIKLEAANLPLLRIHGQPKQRSSGSWEYTVSIQDGDPNVFIPLEFLQTNREVIDVSTMVSDELNEKFGGDQFAEMFKLQSHVGNFARKAEFTDKFIRREIAARKSGKSMSGASYSIGNKSYSDGAIGVGYVYQQNFKDNAGKVIPKGVFVSNLEARLEERLMRDVEMNMEFGRLQKTMDDDSGRTIKVAPGWKQISKDGSYLVHNGSLTLADIESYINNKFLTRREFSDRKIRMAGGEAAIAFMHRLIAAEASQYQLIDNNTFINKVDSPFHDNALSFGAQFTQVKLLNGLTLEMVYDPIKDDPTLFPIKAPGEMYSLESYRMDFFDFGSTDQIAIDAKGKENMTCVKQDGVEAYWHASNVYNFETGVITDGSNAYGNSKELGIYRETSGALCIWDVSRIGSIVFEPVTV